MTGGVLGKLLSNSTRTALGLVFFHSVPWSRQDGRSLSNVMTEGVSPFAGSDVRAPHELRLKSDQLPS